MLETIKEIKNYSARQKKILLKRLTPFIAVIIVVFIVIACILVASLSPKKTEISVSSVITEKKNYKIENLFCETLSEQAVTDGWRYYYVDTADSGATIKDWISPEGCVAVELSIDVTNLSKEATTFSDRMGCKLVYNNSQEMTASVMQENPNQIAENGNKCRSTVSVPINNGESAKCWFMIDIPKEMRDSSLPLEAVITVDNNTYTVNLRENMKIFSE